MRKTWLNLSLQNLDMRELIVNHASVVTTKCDEYKILGWLRDVIRGIAFVVDHGIVENSLRMKENLYETSCGAHERTLHDLVLELQRCGYRDEYSFFIRLATKVPLLNELGEDIKDRFLACEEHTLAYGDGDPLVLCAISNGISVGFPSKDVWDKDRLEVHFSELLSDDTLKETSEEIDQLTRDVHAKQIEDRHLVRARVTSDFRDLWERRGEIFPNLVFGPDVQANLANAAAHFETIIAKLSDLDISADEWKTMRGPAPIWRTHVTPENPLAMKNKKFRDSRRFRSSHGGTRIFEWHARYGGGGRIHFRFDAKNLEIEIGYVGPHLPL